jgi:hypothetical protein
VHLAELGDAQGQIAIALEPVLEDLHMTGAVHRLARIDALVRRLGDVHEVAELLPVAGLLPQRALHHVGRVDLDITPGVLAPAHIGNQRREQRPALRMPEHGARRLFLEMEQVHLASQAAVIALLGLFELMQIGLEVFLARPRRAVDALEHRL